MRKEEIFPLNIHLSGLLAFLIFSVLAKFVMKTVARITFAYEQARLVQKKFPKMINSKRAIQFSLF
jgi:hypothetical protein